MMLAPYQHKAIEALTSHKRIVLGSDPGTGKTAVVLEAAAFVLKSLPHGQVHIICDKIARENWRNEIHMWLYDVPDSDIEIIDTQRMPRGATWTIFSYNTYKWWAKLINPDPPGVPLPVAPPIVLAVDEAHALKNMGSKNFKLILGKESLSRRTRYVWLITGTPFPNNIVDSYPLFNFCLAGKLGKFKDFAENHAYVTFNSYGRQIRGLRRENLPTLVENTKSVLHRDLIDDVLPELPDSRDVDFFLERPPELDALESKYFIPDDQLELVLGDDNTAEPERATRISDVDRRKLSTYRMEIGWLKAGPAIELILSLLNEHEQLVVFAHHREVIDKIQIDLFAKKISVNGIIGATPHAKRDEYIADFQAKKFRVLVLSITAASQAITLTAANVAVFVEVPWTGAALGQGKARLRRLGQRRFCLYYFPLFKDSLDESVYRFVKAKAREMKQIENAFAGVATEEVFDESAELISWEDEKNVEGIW